MATAVLNSSTIVVDETVRTQAIEFNEKAHDRTVEGLLVQLDDGTQVPLAPELASFFGRVLDGLTRGPVTVRSIPHELTTTATAHMLGVSRPTVAKWVAANALPSHKVGSHTRFKTSDVLEFMKVRSVQREDAFAALRAWDEANPETEAES